MKLLESQGKEIFKEYGINIPKQFKLDEVDQDVVVKAQVLVGGRGKAGGIKLANKTNVKDVSQQILGMQIKGEEVKQVLIEEKLNIEEEHYLSVTVDRNSKGYICVASAKGGVNIEDVP